MIYLDYNASTPVAPEVAAAMEPYTTRHFGNPHTTHWAGKPAGEAISKARRQVAAAIGCDAAEVVFTSGASEANNHAIKGVFLANPGRGNHVITTQIEHPSVKGALAYLEQRFGAKVTYLAVDHYGLVSPDDVEAAITQRTVLMTIMHANNEVGTIQPIAEIGRIARKSGILFHTDAAQSLGKIPTRVDDLNVDLLSIAGHKLYAPKGVGALYIRKTRGEDPVAIDPLIHGAGQENGRRGGTENVQFIVGLGAACELFMQRDVMQAIRELRDYFWRRLQDNFGDRVRLHGHPDLRLPNTLNVGFRGAIAAELLDRLEGIAASPGSACQYGDTKLSATLAAMHVDPEYGRGAIRWSLGRSTTKDELETVVVRLQSLLCGTG